MTIQELKALADTLLPYFTPVVILEPVAVDGLVEMFVKLSEQAHEMERYVVPNIVRRRCAFLCWGYPEALHAEPAR